MTADFQTKNIDRHRMGIPASGIQPACIILQEIFNYQTTENMRLGFTLGVILAGLVLTFVWSAMRALSPFFVLFLCWRGSVAGLYKGRSFPDLSSWLNNPSFNVSMLADQSLNFM